eukprot:2900480-Lingulodinium_polyedra.AAC.1
MANCRPGSAGGRIATGATWTSARKKSIVEPLERNAAWAAKTGVAKTTRGHIKNKKAEINC